MGKNKDSQSTQWSIRDCSNNSILVADVLASGAFIPLSKRAKAIALMAVLFVGGLCSSQARLGETENELALRYGKPEKSEDLGHTQKRLSFNSKGCSITATILYGNCQHIVYRLPLAEAKSYENALLHANGQGLAWGVPPSATSLSRNRLLIRSDNQAYVLLPEYNHTPVTFYTQKWADWTKKNEAESLKPKPRPNF